MSRITILLLVSTLAPLQMYPMQKIKGLVNGAHKRARQEDEDLKHQTTKSIKHLPTNAKRLFEATIAGDEQAVLAALNTGVSINSTDANNCTPLHHAATHNHLWLVPVLLKKGALVEAQNANGYTPLHFAAATPHYSILVDLLKAGADLHAVSRAGETPLHVAAKHGQIPCLIELLNKGALRNVKDALGRIPLHSAASKKRIACMSILIDCDQPAPLLKCLDNNSATPLETLEAQGGDKALFLAKSLRILIEAKNLTALQYVLEIGAPVDAQNEDGDTVLHLAGQNGYAEGIKLLTRYRANPNVSNAQKVTPTHLAAYQGHAECLRVLIEAGANTDTVDTRGKNPLHFAAINGDTESVTVLVTANPALTMLEDQKNHRPIMYALAKRNLACMNIISNAAYYYTYPENGPPKGLCTQMHIAAYHGNVQALTTLLEQGADIDIRTQWQLTPLHLAAKGNKYTAAWFLLENNADAHAKNLEGKIPLSFTSNEKIKALLTQKMEQHK